MELAHPIEMLEVITYDQDVYYIAKEHQQSLREDLESKHFVVLQGEMVATRSIKKVRPIQQLATTAVLTKEQRITLQNKCASHKKNLGSEPTETHVQHWTEMILRGETLTIS